MIHQYIERESAEVKTEKLIADRLVNLIYSTARENTQTLFKAVTSSRMSAILGFINYDLPGSSRFFNQQKMFKTLDIDLAECVAPPEKLNSAKKIFERQIRYWERRPMSPDAAAIVSPADARMVVGSFRENSKIFLKEKFFSFEEFFIPRRNPMDKQKWTHAFRGGNFAVFRLTPEKYHYNHTPVAGRVVDIYEIDGAYHSCNPSAVVSLVTPFSKNKRVVTIIDTDVSGGTQIGLVAMIEVVALMIGDILQCYSDRKYQNPAQVTPGMFLKKGKPKSLYRPGSSVDVLIFQKNRMSFCSDIISNMQRQDVQSRLSMGFGQPIVETDVTVRSTIGFRR